MLSYPTVLVTSFDVLLRVGTTQEETRRMRDASDEVEMGSDWQERRGQRQLSRVQPALAQLFQQRCGFRTVLDCALLLLPYRLFSSLGRDSRGGTGACEQS